LNSPAKRLLACFVLLSSVAPADELERSFALPPDDARPWVYWYFMDGNLSREGMTADLESMKQAGIGGALFLEVNVGVPRGPVEFMSPSWRELLKHAVAEADRLGLEFALGAGPGWTGSGGPWVPAEQSMQHLVASETTASGPSRFDGVLPRPQPRQPFFGEGTLTSELRRAWQDFYRDVAVLAFPTPRGDSRLADIDEKALYQRAPYSSQPGVKPFLPAPARHIDVPAEQGVARDRIVELTGQLSPEGRLAWDVPPGNWTILRLGRTCTGQTTRPAPLPGLGFECDKFDAAALDTHFEAFFETLMKTVQPPRNPGRGLTTLHFDSWEMSSQNWSADFRNQFQRRRGYDPLHFLPTMTGLVVDSVEVSERFLWDLRQTAQELVVENHALRLKALGRRHGLQLSIEPYDMNPCADLTLGSPADIPQCEFWSKGYGFDTQYSCLEAVSIGHTMGRPIVAAEAFTAAPGEDWRLYPGALKLQTDWAFCLGINRLIFHTFAHQPEANRWPGMTMGPYGVHWQRTQTWWDMSSAYHAYLARCQHLLRRGLPVADILYLAPEGAPHVFRPPGSALRGDLSDRRGYNFDGCAPDTLIQRASVKDGRIVFPDGMSYRVLVLPRFDTMTPELLGKIKQLADDGATVIGAPPHKSPSLSDYPQCDEQVARLAAEIWDRDGDGQVIRDIIDEPSATARANPLTDAKWIWHDEGNPAAAAPVGIRYFRRSVVLDAARAIESARVAMTADNSFEVFINGRSAGTGDNFHRVYETDVTELLRPGENVLTVTAGNGGEQPNPAGLIGTLTVEFHDGVPLAVPTDGRWHSAPAVNGSWSSARELGPADMSPWRLPTVPPQTPDIYPSYAQTAEVLSRLGVPPDFEADGPVRYTHRRDGEVDIYFLGNTQSQPLSANGRFRVTGRRPEWWDAATGRRRALPQFTEADGVTTVPLAFAPAQSGFVVFRDPASATTSGNAKNFASLSPVFEVAGAWDVSFDPNWGGPATVRFERLEDWTKRPEPGIRNYSGTATYRRVFDLDAERLARTRRECYLDVGDVQVMASVRLNGRDLGVAWCAPWQVEIPAGLLRDRGNELEIRVANLWLNRLIGDAGLPPEQRRTWTTRNSFHKETPRVPSGLLGPVQILAAD
jgi:hypothetical protein